MQVSVITATQNPIDIISLAAGTSYDKDNTSYKRVENCVKHRHNSVLEHAVITFRIDDVSRNCYDKHTEVLTDKGWRYFCDLTGDEDIATLNPWTQKVEFQRPNSYISYRYDGELFSYRSQNIDITITPNHNLWVKKYDTRVPDEFHLKAAEDIKVKRFYMDKRFNWDESLPDDIVIPSYSYMRKNNKGEKYNVTIPAKTVSRVAFVRLLAWYLSEGSSWYSRQDNTWRFMISQMKEKNFNHIKEVIENCGLNAWVEPGRGVHFNSIQWGNFLDKCGHNANLKKLPYGVFDIFDTKTARAFLDEYIDGDGTIDDNGCAKIYTVSKDLADDIYTLCYIAGYTASMHIDDRVGQFHYSPVCGNTIRHNYPCYVINISRTGQRNFMPVIKGHHKQVIDYHDMVYCVEVPNHIIFVRRNGKAVWCGNCSHQLVRHRLASYVQQSQRYVKIDTDNDDWYVTPPSIQNGPDSIKRAYRDGMRQMAILYRSFMAGNETKIKAEDARYLLPSACKTNITMTMNAREFFSFLNLRTSTHAQWEIRELAQEMKIAASEYSDQWRQLMELYDMTADVIN